MKKLILAATLLAASGNTFAKVNPNIKDLSKANVSTKTCLVYTLYHESRSESDLANIMVLNTVYDRVKSEKYPSTPCKVIKQKSQYSYLQDGKPDTMKDKTQVLRLSKLVDSYLQHKHILQKMGSGVTHYHKVGIRPSWSKSRDFKRIAIIGRHVFYKMKIK